MAPKTAQKTTSKFINVALVTVNEIHELKKAKLVFKYALESVNQFYKIYQTIRHKSKGTITHGEQDLLRAMLVFACSGLDSVVKQLISDALLKIIMNDPGARQEFQKHVERRLRRSAIPEEKDKPVGIDTSLIASVLTALDPQKLLFDYLRTYLTEDSLQSRDQLLRVAAHFAIMKDQVLQNAEATKNAFDARNEIIHEMDVDLAGKKKRKQRTKESMIEYCENILNVAAAFINTAANKITSFEKGI